MRSWWRLVWGLVMWMRGKKDKIYISSKEFGQYLTYVEVYRIYNKQSMSAK